MARGRRLKTCSGNTARIGSRRPPGSGKRRLPYERLACTLGLLVALQVAGAADAPVGPGQHAGPRIGLVLGGGGAKGAAHIGVIKVLEEMHVPVDCIAGTSMGAIVGAAYATGLSAQQLEQVMTAVNWREILASAPREDIPVRRKGLDFIYTNGLQLGVSHGSVLAPGGLVPTHQIETMFRRIVAGTGPLADFDKLPIPYRAVATNLETGQMVVFDHGDLALAMRASMAVPGAFAPVEYEGSLLVDGMLVRNLPVDVARKTCADVVIAVPVHNPAVTRDNLASFPAVAGQAMNIAIDANQNAQLATLTDKDVAIDVLLKDITSGDFNKVPEAIPIGEAAARNVAAALSRYSLPPREYAEWRQGVGKIIAEHSARIDEVRLSGFNVTNPEVARTFLEIKPGDTADRSMADADAKRLIARGDYVAVSYGVVPEDGRNVLTYRAVEKPWGPNYLMFDVNLSTDFTADTAWGLRVDYEQRWLNSLGGELRSDLQLGRPNILSVEFYQPVETHQRFFVAPSVFGAQTLVYLYQGDTSVAQVDTRRYGAELDGGVALGSWGEYRIGVQRGQVDTSPKVANLMVPTSDRNALGAVTTRLVYDSLDKRLFPTRGSFGTVNGYFSMTGLGADQTYRTASFSFQTVAPLPWRRDVLTLALRGGSDLGSDSVPFYDQFRLGGLFNFSGYQNNQLIGREYALAGVQLRHRNAYLNEVVGTAIYTGASLEAGNVYRRLFGTPAQGAVVGGSLFAAVDSKIGPIYLAYGLSQGGHSAFYLYLGSALEAFR